MSMFAQRQNNEQNDHTVSFARSDHAHARWVSDCDLFFTQQSAWGNHALQWLLSTRAVQAKLKISEPGDSSKGNILLAHELTHKIQQNHGLTQFVQRADGFAEEVDLGFGSEASGLPGRLDSPPFPSEQVAGYEFASSIGRDLWAKVQVVWTWIGKNRFTAIQLLIEIVETLEQFKRAFWRVTADNSDLDLQIEEIKFTIDHMYELSYDDPFLSERFATIAGRLLDLESIFLAVEEAEHGEEGERLQSFFEGFIDGLSSFDSNQVTQLGQRFNDVLMYKHPFLGKLYFQGGMIWGLVEKASKVVKVIFDLMTPERSEPHEQALWEAIAAFKDLGKELLGPNAGQVAYDMGYAIGTQIPDQIVELNKINSDLDFASEMGKKIGPIIVEAILNLLGYGILVTGSIVKIAKEFLDSWMILKRIKRLLPDPNLSTLFRLRDWGRYTYHGRVLGIVETPEGPQVWYIRTGGGGEAALGDPDRGQPARLYGIALMEAIDPLEGQSQLQTWFIKPRTGGRMGEGNRPLQTWLQNEGLRTLPSAPDAEEIDWRFLNAWLHENGIKPLEGSGRNIGDEVSLMVSMPGEGRRVKVSRPYRIKEIP